MHDCVSHRGLVLLYSLVMPFRMLNFWVDRWYVCSILLFSCSHVYVQTLLGLRAWEIRQLGHGHEWSPLLFPEISLFLDVCALRNSTRRICTLNGEVGVMEILGCCIFFWKDSLSHALNVFLHHIAALCLEAVTIGKRTIYWYLLGG